MSILSINVKSKSASNIVERRCLFCGSVMQTQRSSMKVCSTFCNNKISYAYRSKFKYRFANRSAFIEFLEHCIKVEGYHPINPRHPLYKEEVK